VIDTGSRELRARAVLFDLDGVLADSQSAIESAWREWAKLRGLAASQVLSQVVGLRSEDAVRRLTPHLDPAAETVWLEDLEGQYRVTACAGAVELVSSLRSTPWAIVTSGRRSTAIARLEAIGIPLPAVLVTASDIRRGKPDPEGYLAASSELKVAPDQCVVIEDSAPGAMAGAAAGARVIGIRGPALAGAEVDISVNSLRDLGVREDKAGVIFSMAADATIR
jgi:mannitol-1-/sugar-/sorbitol-6-phosphatase